MTMLQICVDEDEEKDLEGAYAVLAPNDTLFNDSSIVVVMSFLPFSPPSHRQRKWRSKAFTVLHEVFFFFFFLVVGGYVSYLPHGHAYAGWH